MERKNVAPVENSQKKRQKKTFLSFPYGKVRFWLWKKMGKTPKNQKNEKNAFLEEKRGRQGKAFHILRTGSKKVFHRKLRDEKDEKAL